MGCLVHSLPEIPKSNELWESQPITQLLRKGAGVLAGVSSSPISILLSWIETLTYNLTTLSASRLSICERALGRFGRWRRKRTMPLSSRASLEAQRMMREAFLDLEQVITVPDRAQLKDLSLDDVRQAALQIEKQLSARQSLRNMRRLAPLFTGLDHYSQAIEILCNGTPYLPWIWAPIKLVLKVCPWDEVPSREAKYQPRWYAPFSDICRLYPSIRKDHQSLSPAS